MKNSSLNILKAICAFLIVFIHCKFPSKLGVLIQDYARIGVPIFFLISGYYALNNDVCKLKTKILKIFRLLIISCSFYFIYNCIRCLLNDQVLKNYLLNLFNYHTIIKMLFFNVNPFWEHLWFLNALLYCYIIQYVLVKFDLENIRFEKYGIILLLLLYIILNLFIVDYDSSNIYLIRNFLFVGLPFFFSGKLINFYHFENKIQNSLFLLILAVLFFVLNIERLVYKSELYVSSILISLALFSFCIKNSNIKCTVLESIGSILGVYIYILHPAVKYIIEFLIQTTNIIILYLKPIIILLSTIILSNALLFIEIRIKNLKKGES